MPRSLVFCMEPAGSFFSIYKKILWNKLQVNLKSKVTEVKLLLLKTPLEIKQIHDCGNEPETHVHKSEPD